MKASIKQISEITGFSSATISNALNNKKGVNKETAEKILEVARSIGYFADSSIKKIRFVTFKSQGTVVNDSPFFSQLIEGVEDESRKFGLETVFYNLDKRDEDYETRLQELLNDSSSALLILATEMSEDDAKAFMGAVSPVVMFDNWFEKYQFNAVLINNTDSVFSAVGYLAEMGHRDIGYLKGKFEIKNFYYRYQGYLRALTCCGCQVNPQYTFTLGTTMEGAYEDMKKLLESNVKLPSAVFADNDMIALGAMRAFIEKGYKIPDDISIIGFDDLPFSMVSNPPLTTLKVPKHQMGNIAVRRLMEVIENDDKFKTKTQICNELIIRDSVKDLRNK